MKKYPCPFCGREICSHSPSSWNHSWPGCPAMHEPFSAGWEELARLAASAHGTTQEKLRREALAKLGMIE